MANGQKVQDPVTLEWIDPPTPKPALAIQVGDFVKADTPAGLVYGRVREIYGVIGEAYLRAAVDDPRWGVHLTLPLPLVDLVEAEPLSFYRWAVGASLAVGAIIRNGRTLMGPLVP